MQQPGKHGAASIHDLHEVDRAVFSSPRDAELAAAVAAPFEPVLCQALLAAVGVRNSVESLEFPEPLCYRRACNSMNARLPKPYSS